MNSSRTGVNIALFISTWRCFCGY